MDLSASWEYIQTIAQKRLQHNRTVRHVDKYGSTLEVLGAAGELAARRLLGLPEDLHDRFDNGRDIFWKGWGIDVKTTHLNPKIAVKYLQWQAYKWLKIILSTSKNACQMVGNYSK